MFHFIKYSATGDGRKSCTGIIGSFSHYLHGPSGLKSLFFAPQSWVKLHQFATLPENWEAVCTWKMDGFWIRVFPFGAIWAYFQGLLLLVLGSVYILFNVSSTFIYEVASGWFFSLEANMVTFGYFWPSFGSKTGKKSGTWWVYDFNRTLGF